MEINLNKKDMLLVLRDMEERCEKTGDYVGSTSIEVARSLIKRVTEPINIVYISPAGHYVKANVSVDEK